MMRLFKATELAQKKAKETGKVMVVLSEKLHWYSNTRYYVCPVFFWETFRSEHFKEVMRITPHGRKL